MGQKATKKTADEKEVMFMKSKESMQEVSGWKVLIFLPNDTTWRTIVISTVFCCTFTVVTKFYYSIHPDFIEVFENTGDVLYLADVVFATLHYTMARTRRLRFGKKRPVSHLLADYISLMPLKDIWLKCRFCDEDCLRTGASYLSLIQIIRFYQIPVYFATMRNTAYTVKKYLYFTIIEIILYYFMLNHVLGCVIYLYFDEHQKKACKKKFMYCIAENFMVTFFLIGQHYTPPVSGFPLLNYKSLIIIDFFIGYIFTWGFVAPILIFANLKKFITHAQISYNISDAKILTSFGKDDKKMEKKISDYLRHLNGFGMGKEQGELLGVFPTALKKSICCDLHWEAMRHSYILQDLSMGCKRSLAVVMITKFVLPNTILYEKNKGPTTFLYLESGMVQVLAEESSSSSVLNLSAGTVFGEISFYYHKTSPATITAGKYCVVHELKIRDFFAVLRDYPRDKRRILHKVRMRMELAKNVFHTKRKAIDQALHESFEVSTIDELKKGNIKWLKKQYREISCLRDAENMMIINQNNQLFVEDYQRQLRNLETNIKHTSLFINLLAISEEKENAGRVCLKNSLFCAMDPDCYFLTFWKRFVNFTIVFIMLFYPGVIGWVPIIPMWFYVISAIVSLILELDLAFLFVTAVRTNNYVLKKFSSIFMYRVLSFSFFIDFAAAVPLQLFFYNNEKPFFSNCYFAIALIKVYKFIPSLRWISTEEKNVSYRILINYTILLFVFTYWASAVFNLTGVECIFYPCGPTDWHMTLIRSKNVSHSFPPLLRAIKLSFEVSTADERTHVLNSFIVFLLIFLTFHFYNLQMKAGCIAAFSKDMSTYVEFRNTMQTLYSYLTERNITGNIRTRAVSMMQFQWDIEGGITYAQKLKIYDILQENIKKDLNLRITVPILLTSKLFQGEPENFLLDISKRSSRLFFPPNSVLLTFGTQTSCLYIVEKGYVQINSFMLEDLHLNTSKRITAEPGDAFPVIDAFTQTPTAISAVTMTECKLLLLNLEDVLSFMMIHGIFKDVVLTVKDTDLSALKNVKLAVSEFKDVFDEEDNTYRKMVFRRVSYLGKILKIILKKHTINSLGTKYLIWEFLRVVIQIISFILWPVAMSFFAYSKTKRIFFASLLPLEIFPLVDFYIRMNAAYYDSRGIYITHTLYTFLHYLTTSFIVDLIAFAPNFHIIYIISQETYTITWSCYIVHMLMRSVSLYRYIGCMHYIRSQDHKFLQLYIAMFGFLIVVLIHHFICFIVLLEQSFLESKIILMTQKTNCDKPHQHYFNEWGVLVTLVLRSVFDLEEYDLFAVVTISLGSVVGMLSEIVLYSYLAVKFTVSKKNLVSYRYFINSFVTFLGKQSAEYATVKDVVEYYEFRWRKLEGICVKDLVSGFPQSLQEDILLPVYKDTLSGICCFLNANDYFYRVLSRSVEEVVLMQNYTVIFQNEVQVNIYFLHKGNCVVENSSTTLVKGALIGDIKRMGIMTNTITAKSDVILLKIPSEDFFRILNDFYILKCKYETVVKDAEDFITSVFKIEGEVLSKISSKVVEKEYLECEFVDLMTDLSENQDVKKKKKKWVIVVNTKVIETVRFIFLLDAYITVIIIPFFLMTRLVTSPMFTTIYFLDLLWLVKIIMNLVTVSSEEAIAKTRRKVRLLIISTIYNTLSLLPIEFIPLLYYDDIDISDRKCYIFTIFYVNRCLRIFYIFHYFKMKRKQVMINVHFNIIEILLAKIAFINILSAVRLQLHHELFTAKVCYASLTTAQKEELLSNYLCMVNVFICAALQTCMPSSVWEIVFQLFVTICALVSKAYLLNYVLVKIYLNQYNNTVQKAELQHMGEYLKVRDVSSILHIKCLMYYNNLLNTFHEGGEPHFLKTAPPCLKLRIMKELCLSNLIECELFQRVDENFLKQLAMRLSIQVYFPGDHITEKGDVDHNMYFIKQGEVYCVENDRTYTAMETATYVLGAGDTFGLPQGVLLAYPHSHTYRAKTSASILVLNYYAWKDLRMAFPDIANFIYSRCLEGLKSPETPKNG